MTVQFIFNIIISSSELLLIAVSFSLIYQVTKFFHFAHAIVFTSGAYFTFLFNQLFHFSLLTSIPLAIISASLLGSSMELLVYKSLRRKNSNSLILLLASLGIYIVLQNVISMTFGDDTKSIRTWPVREGIDMFGARITHIQIVIIFVSILLVVMLSVYLSKARVGKTMRAVASDAETSKLSGIDSDKVILISFAIGSALAGIAGILISLDIDMTPTMGMDALLMGVVVMIIGGVGSIRGITLGSLLLALAQNFGVWYISSQWQEAIAFAVLLIFLLFKPEGFMGKKIRRAEV